MSWDDYAEDWDQDEAARAYSVAAFEGLGRLADSMDVRIEGARVLDFGCGTGLLTEKLAPMCAAVVGVDTSLKMIERLREKLERLELTNVTVTTTKIEDLAHESPDLVAAGFDFVVCSSVCAFVEDYPGTVRSLVDLLKPGGVFVQWDWELDADSEDPYGLTREQISKALSVAKLDAIRVETAFELPFGEVIMRPLLGAGVKGI